MKRTFMTFSLPLVRLIGHQIAAAAGFAAVAFICVFPILIVEVLRRRELVELVWLFQGLERAIIYLDIFLYCVNLLFSAIVFVLEEIHALKKAIRHMKEDHDD